MNRKATIAATLALAAVTLTGCDDGQDSNPLNDIDTTCDGPNRIYRLANWHGIAVVKDDPRCTDSEG